MGFQLHRGIIFARFAYWILFRDHRGEKWSPTFLIISNRKPFLLVCRCNPQNRRVAYLPSIISTSTVNIYTLIYGFEQDWELHNWRGCVEYCLLDSCSNAKFRSLLEVDWVLDSGTDREFRSLLKNVRFLDTSSNGEFGAFVDVKGVLDSGPNRKLGTLLYNLGWDVGGKWRWWRYDHDTGKEGCRNLQWKSNLKWFSVTAFQLAVSY